MTNNYELLKNYADVLTYNEVKEILRYGRAKTYKILKNGEISSFKDGKNYRILKSSIIEYLNRKIAEE